MKRKVLQVVKYLVFLGIGIALVAWQIGQMTVAEQDQFVASIKNIHYIYLVPVIGMALLSHISRAIRWKILIEAMGEKASTSNTFYATMCGYLANSFVPRAGEILRCTLLARYEKIPFPKLMGTIIVERLVDLVSYFLVIVITVLIQIQTVRDFINEKIGVIAGNTGAPAWIKITIVVLAIGTCYLLLRFVYTRYGSNSFVGKIRKLHAGLQEGLLTIIRLRRKKAFIAHSVFIWAMYLLQISAGFYVMNETAHLGTGAAFSILSLTTLAMIISPGGMGAFPVAVQQVLLIYHVDNISFGWLMWGVNTSIILVLGILCFGLLIYKNKITNEKNRQYSGADTTLGGSGEAGRALET